MVRDCGVDSSSSRRSQRRIEGPRGPQPHTCTQRKEDLKGELKVKSPSPRPALIGLTRRSQRRIEGSSASMTHSTALRWVEDLKGELKVPVVSSGWLTISYVGKISKENWRLNALGCVKPTCPNIEKISKENWRTPQHKAVPRLHQSEDLKGELKGEGQRHGFNLASGVEDLKGELKVDNMVSTIQKALWRLRRSQRRIEGMSKSIT